MYNYCLICNFFFVFVFGEKFNACKTHLQKKFCEGKKLQMHYDQDNE